MTFACESHTGAKAAQRNLSRVNGVATAILFCLVLQLYHKCLKQPVLFRMNTFSLHLSETIMSKHLNIGLDWISDVCHQWS